MLDELAPPLAPEGNDDLAAAVIVRRPVVFSSGGKPTSFDTAFYDREKMGAGLAFEGPATCWLFPRFCIALQGWAAFAPLGAHCYACAALLGLSCVFAHGDGCAGVGALAAFGSGAPSDLGFVRSGCSQGCREGFLAVR
ncbi:hypothetical protein [Arthrobacter sp. UYCu723]